MARVPEKAEKDIAKLGDASSQQILGVLAAWMKEQRESWERHLGKQDKKLEEIHLEVRKTNGRVTDLEKKTELATAVKEGEERVTADLTVKQQRQFDRGAINRQTLVIAAATLGGAGIGYLGHAVGGW